MDKTYSVLAKDKLGTSPEARMGLRTGMYYLDNTIRGLHPGKLYVVAGRPGDGKTSFGTTLAAQSMIAQNNNPVLFISTELDEQEIVLQMAEAYSGGVPVYPNKRTSSESEQRRLTVALEELSEQEHMGILQVVHQKSVTIKEIKEWIEAIQPEDGRQMIVIIDQASRIKRNDERGRRSYAIATEEMLNQIEEVADKTGVAVILITQLNRATEQQAKPTLGNIKHSGAFEEFAHCVMLLEKNNENGMNRGSFEQNNDAIIHVAKNRHGVVGPIECFFTGESHFWEEKPR